MYFYQKGTMKTRVWTAEEAPFPREGLNPLLPSENCQIAMLMSREGARLARLSQLDVPKSIKELNILKRRLRKQIWEKLGTVYDRALPLEMEEHGVINMDGFSIRKITYQGRPDIHVTALLYVPDGHGPFPAVIHPHGHHLEGKMGDRQQNTSMALVRNGYVVLAPDAFGVYERAVEYRAKEYHGAFLGAALFNIGETLMGAQLVDNMRGVDLLCSLPFVRKDRIGATGASGGGNQTMWLAAMDDRIAAAMPVVSVGSFASYVTGVNCVCELLPDGLTLTEEAGVLAMIAPRPLRIGNAYYDVNPTFGVAEMLKTFEQVKKVYWMLGRADAIDCTIAAHVHGMFPRQIEAVLGWFDCHLKKDGQGRSRPIPPTEMLSFDELAMFPSADKRPKTVRTIADHCIYMGKLLRERMLAEPCFELKQKQEELKKNLRLRTLPHESVFKRYSDMDGIQRYALEVGGDHLIPILAMPGNDKCLLMLHPSGKEFVDDAAVSEAYQKGYTVVSVDLFGTGETCQPNEIMGRHHQLFRQLLWIGRSLPGEWLFDILAMVRAIRRHLHCDDITVRGELETGTCAILAAALSSQRFNVEAVNAPASMLFCRESIATFAPTVPEDFAMTPALSLPGFLSWGDVSLASAMAIKTGHDVHFTQPCAYDSTPYSAAQQHALSQEIADLRKKLK